MLLNLNGSKLSTFAAPRPTTSPSKPFTVIPGTGTRYEGQTRDGKPWGRGTMTYKNGEVYSGDWERGLRHGRGRLKYPVEDDKDYYDGAWKDDEQTGRGTVVWRSGDRYEGDVVKGKKEGTGVYYYSPDNLFNGVRFEGQFKNDKIDGNGTMYWRDKVP